MPSEFQNNLIVFETTLAQASPAQSDPSLPYRARQAKSMGLSSYLSLGIHSLYFKERNTQTQIHIQTYTHTNTRTHTETHIHTQTYTQTQAQTHTDTHTQGLLMEK